MVASLGEPEKTSNSQGLGEMAVPFVVQFLCDGKLLGLFEVLTGVVGESGPS